MGLNIMISEYLDFIRERKLIYETDETLEIITDFDEIMDYCLKNHTTIGIVNRNQYNIHLVDLVKNKSDEYFLYERIIKAVQGNSVVIMPWNKDKIILLKQFRHALGDYQYAFPRGFGEIGLSSEENARKEIKEELNCDSYDYVYLGNIVADSGLCGEKVNAFMCKVDKPVVEGHYENIVSCIEVTESELKEMIKEGVVNDGFTLSAVALYYSLRPDKCYN